MRQRLYILILTLFAFTIVSAQEIVVIGQVLDANDAAPLEAAHVWFKGTDNGTTTNEDGYFMLRSDNPQKTLIVSVIGYKRKEIKLDYGSDQAVEVFMKESVNLIDEILVMPGENPALEILRNVNKRRHENNPDNMVNIAVDRRKETSLYLTDIKQKAFQRRLFSELKKGSVPQEDSSYVLPVYLREKIDRKEIFEDSAATVSLSERQNAVRIFNDEHWNAIVKTYTPKVNFYKSYVTFMDKNFMSPLAQQARSYYHFILSDSTLTNDRKEYVITFRPKNDKLLLFKGSMKIDAQTYALTDINAIMPATANINYVNDLHLRQRFDSIGGRFYYGATDYNLGLNLNLAPGTKRTFFGAILNENTLYSNLTPLSGDSISITPKPIYVAEEERFEKMWNKIDTLNQTRIKKLAYWLVDIGFNQYLHLWKIDVGPLLNLYHYNRFEGHSPRLTLRSGEKFAKNFTVGGYFGYGTIDQQFKYGGEIQWRFGPTRKNTLSAFYDRKAYRYGYDDFHVLQRENKVEEVDHLVSSVMSIFKKDEVPSWGLREQLSLRYRYEEDGFRMITEAYGQRTYSNEFLPFIQGGQAVNSYDVLGLKADFRLSWKEGKLDYFFHPYYLSTTYPIVHINANAGIIGMDYELRPFAKFTVNVRQTFPLLFGKMYYFVEGAAIVGSVPYPMLFIPRGTRSWYFNKTDFVLMNQMEFMSDLYIGANIRYQTPGWLFGIIPGVKKLDLRESLMFNIAYGGLRNGHRNNAFALPPRVQSFGDMPYMECGIGISNILRLITVESVWRLTHRDSPLAINWSVRFRVDLEF